MNAITVVEGLLPLLQPQLAVARLISTVPRPAGRPQPSKLAATLLCPSAHAPASPQHRNRVAALLLQAWLAPPHISLNISLCDHCPTRAKRGLHLAVCRRQFVHVLFPMSIYDGCADDSTLQRRALLSPDATRCF